MSVIDRALREQTTQSAELPPMTLREAAVALLVASVASDGAVTSEEATRVNMLISSMNLYRQAPREQLQQLIETATVRVSSSEPGALLAACAAVIPDELRAPLFALAVELVFADRRVAEREKEFVDALQTALAIEEATALKIVEVILLKSRA